MALFKILSGNSDNFTTDLSGESASPAFNEGYCYFIKDNQKLYIDWMDGEEQKRTALVGESLSFDVSETPQVITLNNAKAVIEEAIINRKIPIRINYLDGFKFHSLTKTGYIQVYDADVYQTEAVFDEIDTHQFIVLIFTVMSNGIQVQKGTTSYSMAKKSEKGKIATYGDEYIEGKDLWYRLGLISTTGVFSYSNANMNNFITEDNKNSIRVIIEPDESYLQIFDIGTSFKYRQAFLKANFSVSLDPTTGIVITNSNVIDNNMEYISVSLLIDNEAEQTTQPAITVEDKDFS